MWSLSSILSSRAPSTWASCILFKNFQNILVYWVFSSSRASRPLGLLFLFPLILNLRFSSSCCVGKLLSRNLYSKKPRDLDAECDNSPDQTKLGLCPSSMQLRLKRALQARQIFDTAKEKKCRTHS